MRGHRPQVLRAVRSDRTMRGGGPRAAALANPRATVRFRPPARNPLLKRSLPLRSTDARPEHKNPPCGGPDGPPQGGFSSCPRVAGSARMPLHTTEPNFFDPCDRRQLATGKRPNGVARRRFHGRAKPAARASARPRLVLFQGAWPCLQWNNHRRRALPCPKAATAT